MLASALGREVSHSSEALPHHGIRAIQGGFFESDQRYCEEARETFEFDDCEKADGSLPRIRRWVIRKGLCGSEKRSAPSAEMTRESASIADRRWLSSHPLADLDAEHDPIQPPTIDWCLGR